MASHLRPLPVRSGMLHHVRDWKSWLAPLDRVKVKDGIVGLASAHWLCVTRRRDLPLDAAALASAPGDAPGDVMVMAKEFMSSPALQQAPLCLCQSGQSNLLPDPTGPARWESNKAFEHEYRVDAARLAEKVRRLLPARARAVEYIEEWMARPLLPADPPKAPAILTRHSGQQQQGDPIGVVLDRAVSQRATGRPRLLMRVNRLKNATAPAVDVSLAQWVCFRTSQGIPEVDATAEWNGAQLLQQQQQGTPNAADASSSRGKRGRGKGTGKLANRPTVTVAAATVTVSSGCGRGKGRGKFQGKPAPGGSIA